MKDNIWKVEWLEPRYSRQKSFYKRARVETKKFNEGFTAIELWSYGTNVARIVDWGKNKELQVFGWYSQTTAKHINEFLLQNGYERMNKKQMQSGRY